MAEAINLDSVKKATYGALFNHNASSDSLGKNIGRSGSPSRDKIPSDRAKFSLALIPYKIHPIEEAYPEKYQLKISIFKHIRRIPVEVILDAPTRLSRDLWFIARKTPAPILRSRSGRKSSTQKSLSI